MKTNVLLKDETNIVQLSIIPKAKPSQQKSRFKITEFLNPSGAVAFRVSGSKLDGSRIRENFTDNNAARCRRIELETESLKTPTETSIRATKLSTEQIALFELAALKMGENWMRIIDMIDLWNKNAAKKGGVESPFLDDAVCQFLTWVETVSGFREATIAGYRNRLKNFRNAVKNVRVSEITPEFVEEFLSHRKTSRSDCEQFRLVVSAFASWCIQRPRHWMTSNPCSEIKIPKGEKGATAILSLDQCKALLNEAQEQRGGLLAPYIAICLFGGLRPFEARRLNWNQVNLKDREIRLDATQVKTGRKTKRGRTIAICDTLAAWLNEYEGKAFFPKNWQNTFEDVRSAAGIKTWINDILRHTAISHFFRKTGSYGLTAEQFGNSEAIIKTHYQGRVSSDDTKAFYALMPKKNSQSQSVTH